MRPRVFLFITVPSGPKAHQIGAAILGILGLAGDVVTARGSPGTRGNVILSWPGNEAEPCSPSHVFFPPCFLL